MTEIEQTPLELPEQPSGRHRPMDRVSSLFDISLQTANRFYTFGWSLSVAAALIAVLGVTLLLWGTRVRDHAFEADMATLHDRAAASEKLSEELKKGNLKLQMDLERERSARQESAVKRPPRALSPELKKTLAAMLSPFAGQKIQIYANVDDTEGNGYAADFLSVFAASKWAIAGGGITYGLGKDMKGVQLIVSSDDVKSNKIPLATEPLLKALKALGLIDVAGNNGTVASGDIQFIVGKRP